MRIGTVIAIAGAHGARNAAPRLPIPVSDGSCRARIQGVPATWRTGGPRTVTVSQSAHRQTRRSANTQVTALPAIPGTAGVMSAAGHDHAHVHELFR
jgi:hypothetical protein